MMHNTGLFSLFALGYFSDVHLHACIYLAGSCWLFDIRQHVFVFLSLVFQSVLPKCSTYMHAAVLKL